MSTRRLDGNHIIYEPPLRIKLKESQEEVTLLGEEEPLTDGDRPWCLVAYDRPSIIYHSGHEPLDFRDTKYTGKCLWVFRHWLDNDISGTPVDIGEPEISFNVERGEYE